MLFDRASFCVALATTKDDPRLPLDCVRIGPDGSTMATDARWLMVVSPCQERAEEFPDIGTPGVDPPETGALVPVELVADVLKAIPKNGPKPILRHAQLVRADGEMVEFGTTDLQRVRREGCRVDDLGTFPDLQVVIPQANRAYRAHFKPKTLLKALKALSDFNRATESTEDSVELCFGDPEAAVLMRSRSWDGRQAVVVLMPNGTDAQTREEQNQLAGPLHVTPWEEGLGIKPAVSVDPVESE